VPRESQDLQASGHLLAHPSPPKPAEHVAKIVGEIRRKIRRLTVQNLAIAYYYLSEEGCYSLGVELRSFYIKLGNSKETIERRKISLKSRTLA
jgi:hypothetical protein